MSASTSSHSRRDTILEMPSKYALRSILDMATGFSECCFRVKLVNKTRHHRKYTLVLTLTRERYIRLSWFWAAKSQLGSRKNGSNEVRKILVLVTPLVLELNLEMSISSRFNCLSDLCMAVSSACGDSRDKGFRQSPPNLEVPKAVLLLFLWSTEWMVETPEVGGVASTSGAGSSCLLLRIRSTLDMLKAD